MNNEVFLIGRLTDNPKIDKSNNKICNITIATTRQFKNEEGIYEIDYIPCVLWHGIANSVVEWCRKGDLLGIRGSLRVIDDKLIVHAEKVSFLSTKKENESEENKND